jgi:hypothetical protein
MSMTELLSERALQVSKQLESLEVEEQLIIANQILDSMMPTGFGERELMKLLDEREAEDAANPQPGMTLEEFKAKYRVKD